MAHRAFASALSSSMRGAITTRLRTASKLPSSTLGSLSLGRNAGLPALPHRQLQRALHATGRFAVVRWPPLIGTLIPTPEGYVRWTIRCENGLSEEQYTELARQIEADLYLDELRPTEQDSSASRRFELYMYYLEPAKGQPSECQFGCFLAASPYGMLDKLMRFDDVMCVVQWTEGFYVCVCRHPDPSEGDV